jgi:hypothetical protein
VVVHSLFFTKLNGFAEEEMQNILFSLSHLPFRPIVLSQAAGRRANNDQEFKNILGLTQG